MNNVFIPDKKGQAILELAIFGSILIMLLGVLLSYGLRYDYQQLAIQRSFRQALGTSVYSAEPNKPISVSHMLVENHHIPDPKHPFAVGTVTPITSTASVTRSAKMHYTADKTNELGVTTYHIDGKTFTFKNGELKRVNNVDEDTMKRYALTYDSLSARNSTLHEWVYWENGDRTYIGGGKYSYSRVLYIDDAAGEIMTYEAAKRKCRMVIDSKVCEEACKRQDGSRCSTVCSKPIPVPWYCGRDYVEIDSARHVYVFPFLDRMFAFAKGEDKDKMMGLQQDYLQQDRVRATLRRTDNVERAETRDTATISTRIEREIVSREYGDTTPETETQTVVTNIRRKQDRIWRTPWD